MKNTELHGKEKEAQFTMVQIEKEVKRKAKVKAAQHGMPLREYISFLVEQDSKNA